MQVMSVASDAVDVLVGQALDRGSISNDRFCLIVGEHEIWVRDVTTDMLVAYSSMSGDRIPSLQEFVLDYFTT